MSNIIRADFDGTSITSITYDGQPVVLARDVGRAMGYSSNGGKLVANIRLKWADEFTEGEHFHVLQGPDLAAVKELVSDPDTSSHAPSLMLLTEPGLHLACLLSRKPIGKRLRKWLVEEVFPSLIETGSYTLPNTPPAPAIERDPFDRLIALANSLEGKSDAAVGLVRDLAVAEGLLPVVSSVAMLPVTHKYTAADIASRVGHGVSKYLIDRIATHLRLKDDPAMAVRVPVPTGRGARLPTWHYSEAASQRIAIEAERRNLLDASNVFHLFGAR